jgi:hypothetical protein
MVFIHFNQQLISFHILLFNCKYKIVTADLLSELARREKDAGIFPEAELDLFMKVYMIN